MTLLLKFWINCEFVIYFHNSLPVVSVLNVFKWYLPLFSFDEVCYRGKLQCLNNIYPYDSLWVRGNQIILKKKKKDFRTLSKKQMSKLCPFVYCLLILWLTACLLYLARDISHWASQVLWYIDLSEIPFASYGTTASLSLFFFPKLFLFFDTLYIEL